MKFHLSTGDRKGKPALVNESQVERVPSHDAGRRAADRKAIAAGPADDGPLDLISALPSMKLHAACAATALFGIEDAVHDPDL